MHVWPHADSHPRNPVIVVFRYDSYNYQYCEQDDKNDYAICIMCLWLLGQTMWGTVLKKTEDVLIGINKKKALHCSYIFFIYFFLSGLFVQ